MVAQDNLYICNRDRIEVYTLEGHFLRGWWLGFFPSVTMMRIAVSRSEVYVVDFHNSQVKVYDKEGKFLRSWGNKGKEYRGQKEVLHTPTSIALSPSEREIFVMDNYDLKVFTSEGEFLRIVECQHGSRGDVYYPRITVSRQGRIYVTSDDHVQVIQHYH
jgi:hypothetical protein